MIAYFYTDEIVQRVAGRWTHLPSGRVYNTEFNPPKNPVRPILVTINTRLLHSEH